MEKAPSGLMPDSAFAGMKLLCIICRGLSSVSLLAVSTALHHTASMCVDIKVLEA
jgi:hypothetical protein